MHALRHIRLRRWSIDVLCDWQDSSDRGCAHRSSSIRKQASFRQAKVWDGNEAFR